MQEMLQPRQCRMGKGNASTSTLAVPHASDALPGTEEPGQALLQVWSVKKSQLCINSANHHLKFSILCPTIGCPFVVTD